MRCLCVPKHSTDWVVNKTRIQIPQDKKRICIFDLYVPLFAPEWNEGWQVQTQNSDSPDKKSDIWREDTF